MQWQIQAAMSSGMVAAIQSDRYGCDGELVSLFTITASLSGLVTLLLARRWA
ncbi:MAG: hypothetical protein GX837_10040 [Methanomicrobiales archaeon]|nr:hypothetical protein [Methanomicrobiales archaeon]